MASFYELVQIVNAFARLAAAHTRDAQWADANASKLIGALQEREALRTTAFTPARPLSARAQADRDAANAVYDYDAELYSENLPASERVARVCKRFGIDRSTYYRRLRRAQSHG